VQLPRGAGLPAPVALQSRCLLDAGASLALEPDQARLLELTYKLVIERREDLAGLSDVAPMGADGEEVVAEIEKSSSLSRPRSILGKAES
jgi:hypothetical protein